MAAALALALALAVGFGVVLTFEVFVAAIMTELTGALAGVLRMLGGRVGICMAMAVRAGDIQQSSLARWTAGTGLAVALARDSQVPFVRCDWL